MTDSHGSGVPAQVRIRQAICNGKRLSAMILGNMLACSLAFWALERGRGGYSLLDSLYWGVVTAPTVGYGDVLPTVAATKLLTMWLILSSAAGVIVAGALLTAWLIEDPFEKEVLDDTDDTILMLTLLLDNAGIPVPGSVEEYHNSKENR